MDSETVALRVLAHFKPSNRAIEQVAAESDWLDVRWVAEDDDEAFYRELPEAEVLWHVLRPISGADLEKAPKLKLVHKFGTGVNTIDVDTAAKRGIAVANMPGANAPAVAEATIMLMLAALRKLPQLDRATRTGDGWPTDPALGDTVRELGSCSVGLVGYGNVAKRVEQILRSMGNVTIVHTSSARDDFHINWVSTSELLKKCDIVSLHLPLTAKTEGMIDADAIAGMKPGAILINTARGGIVDEDALADALRSGHLQAAGLDVFTQEPVDPSNPLLALDNVVVTPHVSWYTGETMERYLDSALLNCRRLHEEKSPYYLVGAASV